MFLSIKDAFAYFLDSENAAKLHQHPGLFRECLEMNLTARISADPLLSVQVAKSTEVNPLCLYPV